MKYNAFISYSHKSDKRLAKELRRIIQTLGASWYKAYSARVFLDDISLAAHPNLWHVIEQGLLESEFLVLIASDNSQKSIWVNKEINWWLENKEPDSILIVLAQGELEWDENRKRFHDHSSGLPEVLLKAFKNEPNWIDVRAWRTSTKSLHKDPEFKALASKIAAGIKNKKPEELWSEELLLQRRKLQWVVASGITLFVLMSISTLLTFQHFRNRSDLRLNEFLDEVNQEDYMGAFLKSNALKNRYFVSDVQRFTGEAKLYEALWHHRLISVQQLAKDETLEFVGDSDTLKTKLIERELDPDNINEIDFRAADLPPRQWLQPAENLEWDRDRLNFFVPVKPEVVLESINEVLKLVESDNKSKNTNTNTNKKNEKISLEECLDGGDNDYYNSLGGARGLEFSSQDLVDKKDKSSFDLRETLRAQLYEIDSELQSYRLAEVVAGDDEVLCELVIENDGTIFRKFHPNLTDDGGVRADRSYGSRKISPGGKYFVEHQNGGPLKLREILAATEKALADETSTLGHIVGLEQRIAFSKFGDSFIYSGYRRKGDWENPYVRIDHHGITHTIELAGNQYPTLTVAISTSGNTAFTIDSQSVARVWDLTNEPLKDRLNKFTRVVRPKEFLDLYSEPELMQILNSIPKLSNPYMATRPQCGRTIVKFDGNPLSTSIAERDAITKIGLVDLENKHIIYSIREDFNSDRLFFFCSINDAVDFAQTISEAL